MITSKKILIFGVSGFLGSKLKNYFPSQALIAPTHEELDLLQQDKVYSYIETHEPQTIIYAAGITKIDFAEKNKQLTLKLNSSIPKKIASFAERKNISFIYLSTDAVFDGYKNKYLFSETDMPKAKSIYGMSKLQGEQSILSANTNSTVIRLITLYGLDATHNNFLTKVFNNLKHNKTVFGITDQIQNPLFVEIAAEAIAFITNNTFKGIYHLGALNYDTNYHFLVNFAKRFNMNYSLVKQITFKDFFGDTSTNRKRNSVLLCDKFVTLSNNKILRPIDSSLDYLFEKEKNFLSK